MNTQDCDELVHWQSIGVFRSWLRELQQELMNSFSQIVHAELCFTSLISWGNEDSVSFWVDAVSRSEL